jgi:hypothetical protein
MKGNMHKHTGATATVKWRLPAIQDYKVADHNGIRFVLPNMATNFWSASVFSSPRSSAWRFNGDYGRVEGVNRNFGLGVRCVGGP